MHRSLRLRFVVSGLFAAVPLFAAEVAEAASVTVGANCTFRNAVTSVNNNAATGGCTRSGSGAINTINVPAGTYTEAGELQVTRSVRILGAGRNNTTLRSGGVSAIIAWGTNAPVLEIRDMTVRKLSTQSLPCMGLRVIAPGRLILANVRVADFTWPAVWLNGGTSSGTNHEISDSIIENNTDLGLLSEFADSIIRRTTISNNGGGISHEQVGFMSIEESTIRDNIKPSSGAGIYVEGSSSAQLRVHRSLLRNNRATWGDGGGVYSAGQIYFYNTTFTGNRAARGGGLFHVGAESYLYHTTFSANLADSMAGGAYHNGGQSLWYFNIFANNTAPTNPDVRATFITAKYNLVENTSGYTPVSSTNDILGQDPRLGSLANLGGPTLAFPLLSGSPAIDRIPTSESEAHTVDQRNFSRPVNGPDGSGRNGFDCGSIEQRP